MVYGLSLVENGVTVALPELLEEKSGMEPTRFTSQKAKSLLGSVEIASCGIPARHPFRSNPSLNFRQKIFVWCLSQADWAIVPPRTKSPLLSEKRSQSFIIGLLIIANAPLPILARVHCTLHNTSNGGVLTLMRSVRAFTRSAASDAVKTAIRPEGGFGLLPTSNALCFRSNNLPEFQAKNFRAASFTG